MLLGSLHPFRSYVDNPQSSEVLGNLSVTTSRGWAKLRASFLPQAVEVRTLRASAGRWHSDGFIGSARTAAQRLPPSTQAFEQWMLPVLTLPGDLKDAEVVQIFERLGVASAPSLDTLFRVLSAFSGTVEERIPSGKTTVTPEEGKGRGSVSCLSIRDVLHFAGTDTLAYSAAFVSCYSRLARAAESNRSAAEDIREAFQADKLIFVPDKGVYFPSVRATHGLPRAALLTARPCVSPFALTRMSYGTLASTCWPSSAFWPSSPFMPSWTGFSALSWALAVSRPGIETRRCPPPSRVLGVPFLTFLAHSCCFANAPGILSHGCRVLHRRGTEPASRSDCCRLPVRRGIGSGTASDGLVLDNPPLGASRGAGAARRF